MKREREFYYLAVSQDDDDGRWTASVWDAYRPKTAGRFKSSRYTKKETAIRQAVAKLLADEKGD